MPEYNGNDIYLRMNGADVGARWRSFDLKLNSDEEDLSAGAGIDWKKRGAKLQDTSGTITLIYDDAAAAAQFAALWQANQVIAIVYGPEGNTAGKPCHDQDYFIGGISGPSTGHDKPAVLLEFSVSSTGVPRKNLYAGDTF
ncbi:MAG: hypothetical protein BroJett033_7850 [Chloroflexota bacterium]|nr:MAG: hypothetical protein BroJett033_7850 [Chloroflexota bacterium]